MFESLDTIKKMRISLGINQTVLAQKAGVSQSLIAKIEAGKVEPTYSKALQIFEDLEQLRSKEELKAKQRMNQKVIFAKVTDSLLEVIKLMK